MLNLITGWPKNRNFQIYVLYVSPVRTDNVLVWHLEMRSSREPTPQTLQTEKIVSVHVAIFVPGPGKVEVNSRTSQSRPCIVGRAPLPALCPTGI